MWLGSCQNRTWRTDRRVVLIRNQHDVYTTPAVAWKAGSSNITCISMPGEHDDCWYNPEPYIKLFQ